MSKQFMGIPVKNVVFVTTERFSIEGKSDMPYEVRPLTLTQLKCMGDISSKTIFIFPQPDDREKGIFRVLVIDV